MAPYLLDADDHRRPFAMTTQHFIEEVCGACKEDE